jgi:hypothetical protein
VRATRYVTPLREGGSLPALVEADDDGLYVLKFRGAGQGPRALVAEVLAGELARALGLPVPELVLVELDAELGRAEPDPEIQDLITSSAGVNLGVDFLPGALAFSPAAEVVPGPALAAEVVWLDALVANVDRTPRNPNLLHWHGQLWLIDHGAALFVRAMDPATHVLLPAAGPLPEADARLASRVDRGLLDALGAAVPDAWLQGDAPAERAGLVADLDARLAAPRAFVIDAERARRGVG